MKRQEEIHSKGFNFGRIKVGKKTIEDAVLTLSTVSQKVNKQLTNKAYILKALADQDIESLRAISNHFYRTDGIYSRTCNYFAGLYRYDWYIEPKVYDEKMTGDKIVAEFYKTLTYLDNSNIKLVSNDIARAAIVNGVYYGYFVETPTKLIV